MQSLQAALVRTTDITEIDAKIKNSSFLYINHFSPKNRQPDSLRPYHKANLVQI